MSTEETIQYNVVYNVQGIDQSIRGTQRLLYFMNAVRLSITDIQRVISGPTIANVMWTAVQLTRVWTTLYRYIRMTNQAQRLGIAQGVLGGATRGAMGAAIGRVAVGQTTPTFGEGGFLGISASARTGLWSTIAAFAMANPATIAVAAAALVAGGWVAWDYRERRMREEWVIRQREIAKSQGLEF